MLKRVAGTPSGVFRRRTARAGRRNANSTIPKGKTMKTIKLLAAPLAALAAATGATIQASAQSIYRLDASVWDGNTLDLTSMEGYYADRMEGPLTPGSIEFKGTFVCDPSVSAANPFQIIGNGKQIKVNAANTGFEALPLKLFNASGKTGTSTLSFLKGLYSGAFLDIGQYNKFTYDYNAGWGSGQGVLSTATIKVHDGGQMTADNRYEFAVNMPASVSVTDGASITGGGGIRLGRQNKSVETPVTAFLGITNGTVTAGGTAPGDGKAFTLMFDCANYVDCAQVVIGGETGLLRANCVSHHGAGNSRIQFDGGAYKPTTSGEAASLPLFHVYGHTYGGSWPNPTMTVEGINGHPIDVELGLNRNLSGGSTGDMRKINITGNGGFTKRGAGTLYFNKHTPNSVCDYTGPTTILGGGIVLTNAVFKPGRGALSVADGAFLDLNGFDAEFSGATGAGIVSNRAATVSTLALGYGDADAALAVAVGERVNVVKTGTGTLTVSGAALAATCDLTVEAGKVVFAGHSSSYGIVRVKSGATLDTTGTHFSCSRIFREPGGTVLPPAATVMCIR